MSIITADGYTNDAAGTAGTAIKPIVRSKWRSRIGTTASMSIEQQQEDRIKRDVQDEFS